MRKLSFKNLVKVALVCAIYVALTLILGEFSFGPIQLRVSEILLLLVFYEKRYGYGLIIGCAIANCFSSLGLIDVLVGTIATSLTVIALAHAKHLFVGALFAPLFNLIIGVEIHFVMGLPLLLTCLQVLIGEIIVVLIVGLPLFTMLTKNKAFLRIISLDSPERNKDVVS